MTELKTFVCPNCGANTTNTQNCEYCGSLLVRFVERGIDLSHTTYTSNDAVFPGLIQELKRNLKLQDENPKTWVATDLFKWTEDESSETISIQRGIYFNDGTFYEFDGFGKKHLCIALSFETYIDGASIKELKEFNDKMDEQLAKFRQLDSFPLFTPHFFTFVDEDGLSRYSRGYAMNFGTDAEGTARLASEILIKVKGWSPTEPFDMFTNVGDDVGRAREEWEEAHGLRTTSSSDGTTSSSNDGFGCAGAILAIITTLSTTLYSIFS